MSTVAVDADRWLEIDLYWFDREDQAGSVARFWDRYAPLMEGVTGWRGVIVNAGWLVDHVLAWTGDTSTLIPFPKGLVKDKFFSDTSPLTGTTDERREQWRRRFDQRSEHDEESYPDWTYGDFAAIAELLRSTARQRGIDGLKVGTFVIGWNSIYHCDFSPWSQKHPEAFFKGPWVDQLLNVPARLSADPGPYAAFPGGFDEGTPLTEVFGKQWGALAGDLGLDAIVLRDSMIGQGIYERVGPYGATAPDDPAEVARWSEATADLVRQTKLAAPDALVIGYSNAASAVADWRVNCVDLESIAHEGHLDAWIDQTWAGAWNEVGQREDMFWNLPLQGWTNQLGFVLLRAATLAGTPARHYVLTETFDAWESWDIIHTAPDRLRWGIWAYLHAFVLTPDGPVAPRGSYISWLNQGKRLLSADDVAFLADEINAATRDARDTVAVAGPTAVYSRLTMEWMSRHAPHQTIKEYVDEQIGFLAKFSVPVHSVARLEHVDEVESDLFVLQTPHHLPQDQLDQVLRLLRSGKPVVVTGSPAGGYAPEVAEAVGLASSSSFPEREYRTLGRRSGGRHDDLPEEFPIRFQWAPSTAAADAEVLLEVDGSPALVRRGSTLAWDPADVDHRLLQYTGQWNFEEAGDDLSVAELMGSPYPFVIAAREINRLLAEGGSTWVAPRGALDTMAVGAWRLGDGRTTVLVGELEEGFRDSTDGDWVATVHPSGLPSATVTLRYGESQLLRWGPDGATPAWLSARP